MEKIKKTAFPGHDFFLSYVGDFPEYLPHPPHFIIFYTYYYLYLSIITVKIDMTTFAGGAVFIPRTPPATPRSAFKKYRTFGHCYFW